MIEDSLQIQDRNREPITALANLLMDRSAFIVCGGPSTKQLPLSRLNERGCWSIAVNNMSGHHDFRPQAMICSDPPKKFTDTVWLDPGIMKFVPTPKMGGGKSRCGLRTKVGDEFKMLLGEDGERMRVRDCPNVWAFERRSWLACDDSWWTEPSAAWGNHNAGTLRTGEPKTVCTMLLAMRLVRYLGARRVFLVGVDFHMDPSRPLDGNYSFGESRDAGACESNNSQFAIVNDWLCRMAADGVFRRAGIEFFNCNPISGLRAFPYVSFDAALADAQRGISQTPDLKGWYEK